VTSSGCQGGVYGAVGSLVGGVFHRNVTALSIERLQVVILEDYDSLSR
jgi:hypothetical protein